MVPRHLESTIRLLLLAAACMVTAVGCGKDLVLIHYSQPANAYVFDSDPTGTPHTTTSAGDGMFAFYCIGQIENDDENAQDFTFELSKVLGSGDPDSFPGTSFDALVRTAPATRMVPAHSTSSTLGRMVINVSGGASNPTTQRYNLLYQSAGDESVLFVLDDPKTPPPIQFLDPASPIHPNNLPVCP